MTDSRKKRMASSTVGCLVATHFTMASSLFTHSTCFIPEIVGGIATLTHYIGIDGRVAISNTMG